MRSITEARPSQVARSTAAALLLLFAFPVLLGASLIFFVEPMFAKMVLPLLGGSPAVWNTCVVYFQAVLLAAYLYVHLLTTTMTHGRQVVAHGTLLALSALSVPIVLPAGWTPPPDGSPVVWLIRALTVSLAAPFFVVAATGPLLQRWFSHTNHHSAKDPYFLYSASNLGSLLALLAYPLFAERWWSLEVQRRIWTAGYAVLAVGVLACAVAVWTQRNSRSREITDEPLEPAESVPWRRRAKWMALAFVPSSLMLGVTTYMSTDIAAAPLLWVVPLALYLLSFVVAFARRGIRRDALVLEAMAAAVLALVLTMAAGLNQPVVLLIPLHLCGFFLSALAIHTELARDRPGPARLTEFYLWVAVGGMLGGLFNSLLAPALFNTGILEYPIALILACLLRRNSRQRRASRLRTDAVMLGALTIAAIALAAFLRGKIHNPVIVVVLIAISLPYFVVSARPVWLTAGVAVLFLGGLAGQARAGELLRERTFFGLYKVGFDKQKNVHRIIHGSTVHGEQSLDPAARRTPTSYYSREGPIGQAFQALGPRLDGSDVGVVGLGAGALASYARPGQRWTFYEIDPAVLRIASSPEYFTFLADCASAWRVVLGDARLSLDRGGAKHDLLVLDAFSSDAIPMHLMTREAVQIYFRHLVDDGVIAFHVSNRHLDLRPVLGAIAADLGVSAIAQFDGDTASGRTASEWLLMARSSESFRTLASDSRWVIPERASRAWTDGFSDILGALR